MSTHWKAMRSLPFCFALICVVVPTVSAAWPGVPFAEVRAYAWPVKEQVGVVFSTVITKDGRLEPGALNPKGALLSKSQTDRLLAEQSRRLKGERARSGCYNPHNAFVFSDQQGKTVAFIEICFDCSNARIQPLDEDCDPQVPVWAEIFAELGLPTGRHSLRYLKKWDRIMRVWLHGLRESTNWQRPGRIFRFNRSPLDEL